MPNINPSTVPAPAGPYSQAVLTTGPGQFLHISGQLGLRADTTLAEGFAGQAEAAWKNIVALLAEAGMDTSNLVKVVTYVTDAAQIPALGPVRTRFLGEARPASTLLVVKALAKSEWLIEIEAVAFKA